jgi:uncharacterized membrane-anchored protein YitT (DUF2179 family)
MKDFPMAKLIVGVLIGLVLGLYLDHSSTGGGSSILAQLETILKNLCQF